MIDHRRTLILAAGAIDFSLTSREQAELDEHLATCPACRRDSSHLHAQAIGLRDRPRAVPSVALRQLVEDEWRRESAPRRAASARDLVLVAAAVIIAIVGLAIVGAGVRLPDTTVQPTVLPTAAIVVPPASPALPTVGTLRTFTVPAGAAAHDHLCHIVVESDCATAIASGGGSIWTTTSDGVARVDPSNGKVIATIPVGAFPTASSSRAAPCG